MKRVFRTNYEVCNIWAKNTQKDGRAGNISFLDGVIYSYGYWPMAKIFSEQKAVLFQDDFYSCTTTRHQGNAFCSANSAGYKCFRVTDIGGNHQININHYKEKLKNLVIKFSNTVRFGRWIIQNNNRIHQELEQYCKNFGLKMPMTLGLYLDINYPFIAKRFLKTPTGELFIPKWLAKKGIENVESKDMLRTRNAEIRREIIRRIGIERICYDLKAKILDRQGEYELVLLNLKDGRRRPFLKMHNPSVPEIWHLEGIHPAIKTIQDALNYRRYGNDMFVNIFDLKLSWQEQREYAANPEIWQIKAEYETSPLFPNVNNWTPEKLT